MSSHRRLLAGVGAATFVITALGTSGASAADVQLTVVNPTVTPGPGFAATGVHTEACDRTTAPGWIATATATLAATVQAPAGETANGHFAVRDITVRPSVKILQADAPVQADGTTQTQLTGLADGHTYEWHARAGIDDASAHTADCHFRVDLTPPAVPEVSSTDFPAQGSGATPPKYAGQSGTFTIKGTDTASGVACYHYALSPASMGIFRSCAAPNTVLAAADGSASLQLKVPDWGTNILNVQAIDNAGNVSQSFSYAFYARWNPNPPQGLGDADNDGVPDIVLPDAAGNLQVISGTGGNTAPSETFAANLSPVGQSWTGAEISHRGWVTGAGAPADTVFVRPLGAPGGRSDLLMYTNQGSLQLDPQFASPMPRPAACQDVTGATITCPDGFSTSWADADQIVAPGSVDHANLNDPTLLSVEHGDLWLSENVDWIGDFGDARRLTTTGAWTGYDLIAPGPDAKGNQALWARDRATGQLHVYPLPMTAAGTVDFSALADPAAGVVASGFTTAAYPTLGSSGDLNGDGVADLWAVSADRHLVTFTGWTSPKDLGALK